MILTAAAAAHHANQFWPTIERVVTIGAAIGGGAGGFYGRKNHSINLDIKTAVNGGFAAKVKDLADVTERLKQVTQERDTAVAANHPPAKDVSNEHLAQ